MMNERRIQSDFAIAIAGLLMIQSLTTSVAETLDRVATQWSPCVEWSLKNHSYEGNPYDLMATVTFLHEASGERRTTALFYDQHDTWRFRFTATRPGRWSFTTQSIDADLCGHRGVVTVAPNESAYGFVTHVGPKWARQFGAGGELRAFSPQLVMYDGPAAFYARPKKIDADIQTFLVEHGFSGFHVPVFCRWFNLQQERASAIEQRDPNPDPRTFEALESLITKVHAAGGFVHMWMWGDEQRQMTPVRWGINGRVDSRLQRYLAARLGPLPGWTLGYGFDLDEWVDELQLWQWRDSMHQSLGWPHLLGARHGDPNQGLDHSSAVSWNRRLDYSSYEHHRPTYEVYAASLQAVAGKPVFSEDRFRIRQSARYVAKDYSMERTRRGLWHATMAGGVANIWGNLIGPQGSVDTNQRGSFPYPQPHWIKTHARFFRDRFSLDLEPDNLLTDGRCLKRSGQKGYIFYKEDTRSLRMDLSQIEGPRTAVAIDTLQPYREFHLGQIASQHQRWAPPYRSDWAVAVGSFRRDTAGPDRQTSIPAAEKDSRGAPTNNKDDGPLDALRVLSKSFNTDLGNQMMRRYLRRLSHEALNRRQARLEGLKTPAAAADYQHTLKQFLFETIGPLPDRTPLHARVVARATRDGYFVENVVFESQPGFFVTANLYLPAVRGPHPGILLPCGHSSNGKAAEAYQRAAILLATNGFVVLCFDPIGQGERRQLLGPHGQPVYASPTTEHMVTGIAPILLGRSLATYMIWDGMRAIDYLQSRSEVDSDRIGCTGNSGGGNLTSFLMALDDRIAAAAPGCFITTHRRKNESPGPGDAEQNLFAQLREGLDHPDFILIRAPKPTLILAATHDFVPIAGTWEAFRQAKRFYARLGFPERIDLVETDDRHGFSVQLREGVTRFFSRWLLERAVNVRESDFPAASAADLRCTPDGQVLELDGARSIFDLNRQSEIELANGRNEFWKSHSRTATLAAVKKLTGIRTSSELPAVAVDRLDIIHRDKYRIEKLVLRPEVDIVLPALLFRPAAPNGKRCLFLHDKGKTADLRAIAERVNRGETVLAVDIRDIGETRTRSWRYGQAVEFTGPAGAEWFIAYMLGKSYLAMRAEDVLISARYMRNMGETKANVHVIAHGELGPAALHAAALEPELIGSLELRDSLQSWKHLIENPVTRNGLVNVVHGALRLYDLPDLCQLISASGGNGGGWTNAAK